MVRRRDSQVINRHVTKDQNNEIKNSSSSDLNCTNNHRGLCTIQPHRFNVESAGKSACLAVARLKSGGAENMSWFEVAEVRGQIDNNKVAHWQ